MKVLYFGTYSIGEEYSRNIALIEGLRSQGVEVSECHSELWRSHDEKMGAVRGGFLKKLFGLLRGYFVLLGKYIRTEEFDFMFVGYIGHIDMFLARLLKFFHKKPIIFDAFYSLYDTMVKDRGLYKEGSMQAKLLRFIDRKSASFADLVLLDTNAHIRYYCKEFGLDESKFVSVPLGIDEANFYPAEEPEEDGILEVINYSSYIPLHGLDTIVECAGLLRQDKRVRFVLIGKGQLYPEIRKKAQELELDNVEFIEWLSHKELVLRLRKADVCLGIFGTTEKASRVIPYKVYEALAMGKPVITEDSPAVRELLEHEVNCLLSPAGDARALAENILRLCGDKELRKRIAHKGREIFLERCTHKRIGERVVKEIHCRFLKERSD